MQLARFPQRQRSIWACVLSVIIMAIVVIALVTILLEAVPWIEKWVVQIVAQMEREAKEELMRRRMSYFSPIAVLSGQYW